MKNLFSYRRLNYYGLILAVLLLVISIYMQINLGLKPCSLCLIQRFLVVLMGLLFIGALLHVPTPFWRKVYWGGTLLISLLGVAVAARHVWLLQLPPDQTIGCIPGIEYLLRNLPFFHAMKLIFQGGGDCAKATMSILGLSIPAWTLGFFVLFSLLSVIQLFREVK